MNQVILDRVNAPSDRPWAYLEVKPVRLPDPHANIPQHSPCRQHKSDHLMAQTCAQAKSRKFNATRPHKSRGSLP